MCLLSSALFVFNQFGDLERCALRPGKTGTSADGWREVLEPVVTSRYRGPDSCGAGFRADAASPRQRCMQFLEAEGFLYAIRLPANRVLQQSSIAHLLEDFRPVGRPPKEVRRRTHASFSYKAQSWSKSRRVVRQHPGGILASCFHRDTESVHRHQPLPAAERVIAFYKQRGTVFGAVHQGSQERRSTGPGFPALASATTRCVFSCTPWHPPPLGNSPSRMRPGPGPTEWATGR